MKQKKNNAGNHPEVEIRTIDITGLLNDLGKQYHDAMAAARAATPPSPPPPAQVDAAKPAVCPAAKEVESLRERLRQVEQDNLETKRLRVALAVKGGLGPLKDALNNARHYAAAANLHNAIDALDAYMKAAYASAMSNGD